MTVEVQLHIVGGRNHITLGGVHILGQVVVAGGGGQCGGRGVGNPEEDGAVTAQRMGLLAAQTVHTTQTQAAIEVNDLGLVDVGVEVVGIGLVGGLGEEAMLHIDADLGLVSELVDGNNNTVVGNGQVVAVGAVGDLSRAADAHGCGLGIGVAGVGDGQTALDVTATDAQLTVDHVDVMMVCGVLELAGGCIVGNAATDRAAVDGQRAGAVDVAGVATGLTTGNGTAVDGDRNLAGAVDVAAHTAVAADVAAGDGAAVDGHGGRAVGCDVAAIAACLTATDGAAVHFELGAGGQVDIAAQTTVVGLGAILIGNDGGGRAVFDDAVVHDELAGNIHSAACAAFKGAGGLVALALSLAADDLAAVHVEELTLGNADRAAAGVHNIGSVDGAATDGQRTVLDHDGHAHVAHTVGSDGAGLVIAGVHDGHLDAGLVHDDDTAVICAIDTVAVQIQADLGILADAGLRLGLDIGLQLVVTAVGGHCILSGPLAPGNGLVTMLAEAVVVEHIVGTVVNEDMGDVAFQVSDHHDLIHLHCLGHAALVAGLAGHIPNTVGVKALQHNFHTLEVDGGVELDDGTGSALHVEAPADLLQGQLVEQLNTGNKTVFIDLQTHDLLVVDGIDELPLCHLQGNDLTLVEEADMEIAIALGHTGRHARFGLAGIFLPIQVPVNIIGLRLVAAGGGRRAGRCRGTTRALGQHQRQRRKQHDDSRNDTDDQSFFVFHVNTPFFGGC